MEKRILQRLPSRGQLGLSRNVVLVGTGGTVRALARFEQDLIDYPIDKIHNFSLDFDSVQDMSREFFRMRPEELGKIDAIGEDRAETISAGTLVVRTLMKRLGFRQLVVSTQGLRDGVLVEYLSRGGRPSYDPLKETVEGILSDLRSSPKKGPVDTGLVRCLLRNGLIDARQSEILLKAMGFGRSYDIANSDPDVLFWDIVTDDLPMNHEDQLFLALSIVRSKRPRTANWLAKKYGTILRRGDAKNVKKMGACLKMMQVLGQSGAKVRVSYSGGLRIVVSSTQSPFPLSNAKFAAYNLSEAINVPVSITERLKQRRGVVQPPGVKG